MSFTKEDQRTQEAAWLAQWEAENGKMAGRANGGEERRNGPPAACKGQYAKVLAAARKLARPFTLGELVIAAWHLDKGTFGLTMYEWIYPSDNKVRVCLYGSKGLIARGFIRKLDDGLMEVVE